MEQDRIDQIETLVGHVTALKVCCMALIATHPQRAEMLVLLKHLGQRSEASSNASLASDAAVQAADDLLAQLLGEKRSAQG